MGDCNVFYYSIGEFEIVGEQENNIQIKTIRDILGQDLKTIEFK